MFNQLLNNMFCERTAGDSPKTPLGLLFGSILPQGVYNYKMVLSGRNDMKADVWARLMSLVSNSEILYRIEGCDVHRIRVMRQD